MKAILNKSIANGVLNAPKSKSYAHRLLISAALSDESVVTDVPFSNDVKETISILNALGTKIKYNDNSVILGGFNPFDLPKNIILNVYESASTLRFLLPLLSLSSDDVVIGCSDSLINRPLNIYEKLYIERSLRFETVKNKVYLRGPLKPDDYCISGMISSQFISGLLFALPLLDSTSTIKIVDEIASSSYVDMTIHSLKMHNINIDYEGCVITVNGNQKYVSSNYSVEADYSNAAVLDAFNLINGHVIIIGLNPDSLQGDKVYSNLFKMLTTGSPVIDVNNCIDLAPILFVIAAIYNGATFINTDRLEYKESNRIISMEEELSKCGVDICSKVNSVVINPGYKKPDVQLCSHNDHRIAMALSVLLSTTGGELTGIETVNKSYPGFIDDIKKLGIDIRIVEE